MRNGICAAQYLPPPDRQIDVFGIKLDPISDPRGLFCRDIGRPGTHEGVQYDVAALGDIKQRVDNELKRFWGRVCAAKQLLAF